MPPSALAFVNGVQALSDLATGAGGLLAGIGEGHGIDAAKPHFLWPARASEAQHPFARAGGGNDQIEVAAVAVLARLSVFHLFALNLPFIAAPLGPQPGPKISPQISPQM